LLSSLEQPSHEIACGHSTDSHPLGHHTAAVGFFKGIEIPTGVRESPLWL